MILFTLLLALLEPPAKISLSAPELEKVTAWVNSPALELGNQKGKVIVVHFFAFG
jgi:hypothetical protein